MAAPRPDVKYYLDIEDRDALKAFADHEDISMGELTERVMSEYLAKRIHDASLLAARLKRAGILREEIDPAGMGRK